MFGRVKAEAILVPFFVSCISEVMIYGFMPVADVTLVKRRPLNLFVNQEIIATNRANLIGNTSEYALFHSC
jgi:hypothetical protein